MVFVEALDSALGQLSSLGTATPKSERERKVNAIGAIAKQKREANDDARRDQAEEEKYAVSSDNPTNLYKLLKSKDWPAVISRLQSAPGEASTWVIENNPDGSTRWELLPLHQAIENQSPIEVVEALLSTYNAAVQKKDSGCALPIHLSCRERSSAAVILRLLEQDPDTSKTVDGEGRLPLHLAARKGTSLEVIDQLLELNHRGAKTPDSYGLLALHWACAQNASLALVEALLRANPYAVEHSDKWGRTPLSLAQASTNADRNDIIRAIKRDPNFWTSSLMKQVQSLNDRLNSTSIEERTMKKKADHLEKRLVEVTEASSAAAASFRELKDEVQEENKQLKSAVHDLNQTNKSYELQIEQLKKEKEASLAASAALTERLENLQSIMLSMEEQRLQILQVTGDWESSLQQASDLLSKDD